LKWKLNIAISNQRALFGIILVLLCYCFDYIIASLPFLAKIFMFYILFYIWNTTSGFRAPSSAENCGLNFFTSSLTMPQHANLVAEIAL
jgi:hypothetical protein